MQIILDTPQPTNVANEQRAIVHPLGITQQGYPSVAIMLGRNKQMFQILRSLQHHLFFLTVITTCAWTGLQYASRFIAANRGTEASWYQSNCAFHSILLCFHTSWWRLLAAWILAGQRTLIPTYIWQEIIYTDYFRCCRFRGQKN